MGLDRSFAGREYPAGEPYEVGREKIREFAAALGIEGHDGLVAPPTFPIVLALRAAERVTREPGLGFDHTRTVHREQRFEHHRPVRAGDRLTVRVTVLDVKSIAGTDVLVTKEEIGTVTGEPVCTTVTTLIAGGGR
ncbi:MaoC family dehydratase N-terminal domain-containing protein [Amycolatopsis sp. cg5]|uniref:FAS1-like dehydratase domain-containing protein n=1 Tax=Amycolatopsis sp. cg5 TaxID=3238802 RepID=UPI00352334A8